MMHRVTIEHRDMEYRPATEDDVWAGNAYQEGDDVFVSDEGWFAYCTDCKWEGNNPIASEDEAKTIGRYHEVMGDVEDQRAAVVEEARGLTDPTQLAAAAMNYNRPGLISTVREAMK